METLPTDVQLFLTYDYTETRNILGTFITLVSGTLVLSLTFWDKLIKGHEKLLWVRWIMSMAWAFFFLAVLGGILSLVTISAAAGCALYGEVSVLFDRVACTYRPVAEVAWLYGVGSGLAYALGLMCLSLAAGRCVWDVGKAAGKTEETS